MGWIAPRIGISLAALCCLGTCVAQAEDLDVERAIAKYRMGQLTIQATPNTRVVVEQLRHEFWFGAAISSGPFGWQANSPDSVKYKEMFLKNFNSAVTENALKWHAMERKQGSVDYRIVDAILDWTEKHDLPLRGHNVFWGVTNFIPKWQLKLDDDELQDVVKSRAITIGKRYRGRFAEYDLNNEMIHDNYYEKRLGPEITKRMAEWVRQGDPDAVLYLNDYDILTGNQLEKYVAHIKDLLSQDVPLGGIGVQGHLHGISFDPKALKRSLETLAQFDLPIRVTEFNFPGQRSPFRRNRGLQLTPAEEQAKAEAIVDYYRICFAQPAVHGIMMWGFWEGANWIPASSLYKRDWTATPAAYAYRELIYKTWWTNWSGTTDANGKCTVSAFYGTHRITVGDTNKTVELKSSEQAARVLF